MIRQTKSRTANTPAQAVTASRHAGATSAVRNRNGKANIMASRMENLTDAQKQFVMQLKANGRKHSIMAATNTANIAAKPEFTEYLPLFVQKLLLLDVYGSVAMKSRQQIIPYFKFVAENTKGETPAGTILSSPMVNRQGMDYNFTGRTVKNEGMTAPGTTGTVASADLNLVYTPVLPGSVTIQVTISGTTTMYTDDGNGNILDSTGDGVGTIDYATGKVSLADASGTLAAGDTITGTYDYDNETVGPDENGQYGAKMAKGYLDLDEINLKAEAHELACYWSVFSAFAAQTEYGANIGDMAKEAAFSELTAEINTAGFQLLLKNASYKPMFNWDASPVSTGAVVPSDYLNMFKLTLANASASIYQATRLAQPNRIVCGTVVASYIKMIDGFVADTTGDRVGPYKLGTLDEFEVYVEPSYNPNTWVMCCKGSDIRRSSALFGEYMPFTNTEAIGLANMSVQQGYATMYAMEVVNPDTVVSGRIIGC